jgi:voltage-gated potassium channel
VKQGFRRTLRAQLRDARVLFREFRTPLLLFVVLIVAGAVIFHYVYTFPSTDRHPELDDALHSVFALIFFETLLPFPDRWYVQILFFIIPVLGLAAIADGLLRFYVALTNKQSRGQKWQVALASTYSDHVIVCGIGKVGYRVILELLKFQRDVVAIEEDPQGRFVEKAKALDIPVIIADARRTETLVKSGVKQADAIIPCTDNELSNVDIALDAREVNPNIKVVLRMFDADLARRVEKGFGIHTAFSTSALAAPIFAAAATRVNVKHSFYVGDELLNLSELTIEPDSRLLGWSLKELQAKLDLSVVCYQGTEITDLHPDPSLHLSNGDRILVVASIETLRRLKDLNQPSMR